MNYRSTVIEAAENFKQNGFAHLPRVLAQVEVEELLQEGEALCQPAGSECAKGVFDRSKSLHRVHEFSERFRNLMGDSRITALLRILIGPNVRAVHSTLFFKPGHPVYGRGHRWHQDEAFLPSGDQSLVAVTIALDPMNSATGPLQFRQGSHRERRLWRRDETVNEIADTAALEDHKHVSLEMSPGSMVFFHGYTVHASLPNPVEGAYRRSLTLFYMSAEARSGWRIPAPDGVETVRPGNFLVIGVDPFACQSGGH